MILGIGSEGVQLHREGSISNSGDFLELPKNFDLGDNPLIVEAGEDLVIPAYSTGHEPLTDEYHLHEGSDLLRYGSVSAPDSVGGGIGIITGLEIKRKATLTLQPNFSRTGTLCLDTADVDFENDVVIRGELTVTNLTLGIDCDLNPEIRHGGPAITGDMAAIVIEAYRFLMGDNGLIDTQGEDADASNGRGGDGGGVAIATNNVLASEGLILAGGGNGDGTGVGGDAGVAIGGFVKPQDKPLKQYATEVVDGVMTAVSLYSGGESAPIVNTGDIDTSGGDGSAGGNGSGIEMYAEIYLKNKGKLDASGGDSFEGADSVGGHGGDISLFNYFGLLYNGGELLTHGGDGDAGGGWAGDVELNGITEGPDMDWYEPGGLISAGKIIIDGGDARINGRGGDAGEIFMLSRGADLLSSGRIEGSGGDGAGVYGYGGNGAEMYFIGYPNVFVTCCPTYHFVFPGDILVGNDIIARGGDADGGRGGWGGDLWIEQEEPELDYEPKPGAPGKGDDGNSDADPLTVGSIQLIGFDRLDISGGDAEGYAGYGGNMFVESEDLLAYTYVCCPPMLLTIAELPAGPIVNNVIIVNNGGESADSVGGMGGEVVFEAWTFLQSELAEIDNNARIKANGGDGFNFGGYSGAVGMFGDAGVRNHGAISANGGNGTGPNGNGGCTCCHGIGFGDTKPIGAPQKNAKDGFEFEAVVTLVSYYGDVTNNAIITTNGGDGNHDGGDAGAVDGELDGGIALQAMGMVRNTGDLKARGGNGGTGLGGDGGPIRLISIGEPTNNDGTLDVRGGTGIAAPDNGLMGKIWIDLVDLTPDDGTLGF